MYKIDIELKVATDDNPDYYYNLSRYAGVPYEGLVEIEKAIATALIGLGEKKIAEMKSGQRPGKS
jgi:hypothetical protein